MENYLYYPLGIELRTNELLCHSPDAFTNKSGASD